MERAVLATPIENPDAQYLAETTKLDFAGLPPGVSDSISDGQLTVTFSFWHSAKSPVQEAVFQRIKGLV